MRENNASGFTLIEFLVAIVIFALLFTFAVPTYIQAKDSSREKEVKANIHKIDAALERYGTDHSGLFPAMIWGGDKKSWSRDKNVGCRTMLEHKPFNGKNEDEAVPPIDPLLLYGYLDSYPQNPFLTPNEGLSHIVKWTAPLQYKPGDGDPRFGFDGDLMGNAVEDPKYLWKGPNKLTRIKNSFLDEAEKDNIGMVIPKFPYNPFYAMGGIPLWPKDTTLENAKEKLKEVEENNPLTSKTVHAYWPGEFFYRSGGAYLFPQSFLITDLENPNMKYIWDFPYTRIDRYFLCGFGALTTDGKDVLRLTDAKGRLIDNSKGFSDDIFYKAHPNYPRTGETPIHFSSPEVMGGGKYGEMPVFPYLDPENGEWIYGAPDGFADGIVIAIAPGIEV